MLAAVAGDDSTDDVSITGNDAIDALIPDRGAEVLQQQTVGIDLAAPYRLTSLVISPSNDPASGVEVLTEVEERSGLNRFEFSPAEGKLVEALSPDTNCAVATIVEIARPTETQRIEWCFEVV